mgnify:CR=1 FL=1
MRGSDALARVLVVVLPLAVGGVCSVQGAEGERAASAEPAVDEGVPAAVRERPPLGWLSDPKHEPADIFEALVGGKLHLDNRFRIELADTTGRASSTAITNRIRLGYETKPYYGFSGMIEMENVSSPDRDNYFVPATGAGSPRRTPVADPTGTEVNQAYGRFATSSLGDSGISLDVRGGRQRILLDDERFVGNVGWRQFEQTFDSVSARTNFGVDGLSVFYAYVWEVKRIFGPDGDDPQSDSHLLNVSYRFAPELTVTAFGYLLDFRDDEPLNSTDTYGVRLTGLLGDHEREEGAITFGYELSYARQVDAGSNPVDFAVDFLAVEGKVQRDGLGWLSIGYQFLGSDDSDFGFRFPLGTNHKFQGFADQFLVTPAEGLQDLYVAVGTELAWGIKPMVAFHQFYTDQGGEDLGWELDFAVSKQITPQWSVLLKGAYFDGHSGQPDTTRFWIQTEFRF